MVSLLSFLFVLYSGDKRFDKALFNILKVPPEDLACQITIMDVSVFKAIQPDELTSIAWTTKDKLIKVSRTEFSTASKLLTKITTLGSKSGRAYSPIQSNQHVGPD